MNKDERVAARIAKLPKELQKHVIADDPYYCHVPTGWRNIVIHLNAHLETIEPDYILHQVKEKFGGLRFYTHTPDRTNDEHDLFWIVVSYYENLSFKICDECGNPGTKWIKGGWVKTRCEEHSNGATPCDEE